MQIVVLYSKKENSGVFSKPFSTTHSIKPVLNTLFFSPDRHTVIKSFDEKGALKHR